MILILVGFFVFTYNLGMTLRHWMALFTITLLVGYDYVISQVFIPMAYYKNYGGNLTISDAPFYNFGLIPINSNIDKTFSVTNSAQLAALTVSGTIASQPQLTFKGGTFPGTGGTCSTSLQAGNSCTVVVRANAAAATTVSNTITVSYLGQSGLTTTSRQVTAQFTATSVTSIFVNPNSGNFNVGSTQQLRCYGITSDGGTIELTTACAWSSSNTGRVTVDNDTQKGLITGISNGNATITATYGVANATAAIAVNGSAPSFVENGTGLYARYFSGTSGVARPHDPFAVLSNSRVDAQVNFNWTTGSNPAGGVDDFGAKWTGQIRAPSSGAYCIQLRSDDGARVWINNSATPLVSSWLDQPATNANGTFTFVADVKYNVHVEFYENGSYSFMALRYQAGACPGVATNLPAVPQNHLFPTATAALDIKSQVAPRYELMPRGFTMSGTAEAAIASGAAIVGTGFAGALNGIATNANGSGMKYIATERYTGILFDGVDDYFSVAATSYPTAGATRTISIWVNPTETGAINPFFSYGNSATNNHVLLQISAAGKAQLTTTTSTCTSANNVTYGSWNMITATINGTTAKIYLNGTLDTTCTITAPNTTAGTTAFFGRNLVNAAVFTGSLDDFGIWTVELTAGEVRTFYERQTVINP